MKKSAFFALASFILLLSLAACNFPLFGREEPQATPTVMTIETVVAQTVAASITQAPSLVPTQAVPTVLPTLTAGPGQPTLTPYPTYTPYPVQTSVPCDAATFVADVTIPDNTKMSPGQSFTKTWRIQNSGTCTWTTAYKVVFVSGDQMSGTSPFSISKNVAPGQSVDLSVDLVAPSSAGTFTGNWKLQNASGTSFGLSPSNSPFYVKIVVESVAFAVKSADVEAEHTNIEGSCSSPQTFNLMAHITTNGAGKVTYYWVFDDGTTSSTGTLNFTKATTMDTSTTYSTSVDGNHWAAIYIDQPNHQQFPKTTLTLHCD